ncbi:hypothetical protein [Lachnoclostridium phytofermentans]|uniref:hypothetical protein n=1 Tax=Lachnoclostridium phytofermentans TaxID=66219 RepID=UPI0002FC194B|nr:hypothetical protein [Lachnoclostridium phytofermentans]
MNELKLKIGEVDKAIWVMREVTAWGLNEKEVRQIYLNAGFKIVKIIDYDNGQSMALYEMEV